MKTGCLAYTMFEFKDKKRMKPALILLKSSIIQLVAMHHPENEPFGRADNAGSFAPFLQHIR
jgi:hypothetical protein